VYEQILQVPNYVVFDEATRQLRHFRLVNGRYQTQPIAPQSPQIWVPEIGCGLGLWSGDFRAIGLTWLRWCDAQGNWLATEAEVERRAKEAAQHANETERQAKETERAEKEKLARYLRSIGIDPDNLPGG
jgi:hypothetical protein